jgi:hypothetical protein
MKEQMQSVSRAKPAKAHAMINDIMRFEEVYTTRYQHVLGPDGPGGPHAKPGQWSDLIQLSAAFYSLWNKAALAGDFGILNREGPGFFAKTQQLLCSSTGHVPLSDWRCDVAPMLLFQCGLRSCASPGNTAEFCIDCLKAGNASRAPSGMALPATSKGDVDDPDYDLWKKTKEGRDAKPGQKIEAVEKHANRKVKRALARSAGKHVQVDVTKYWQRLNESQQSIAPPPHLSRAMLGGR